MKKIILTLFYVCLFVSVTDNSYSQDTPAPENQNTDLLKYLNEPNVKINKNQTDNPRALVTVIVGNNSTSSNARAPQGSRLFNNIKTIVTASEMTASGFVGPVTSIGWRWNVPFPPAAAAPLSQTLTTTGNIRVYMKDT
ncbi:MAG: hypothetical protein WAT71_07140, partial [Ignavibacteria bacterium]